MCPLPHFFFFLKLAPLWVSPHFMLTICDIYSVLHVLRTLTANNDVSCFCIYIFLFPGSPLPLVRTVFPLPLLGLIQFSGFSVGKLTYMESAAERVWSAFRFHVLFQTFSVNNVSDLSSGFVLHQMRRSCLKFPQPPPPPTGFSPVQQTWPRLKTHLN